MRVLRDLVDTISVNFAPIQPLAQEQAHELEAIGEPLGKRCAYLAGEKPGHANSFYVDIAYMGGAFVPPVIKILETFQDHLRGRDGSLMVQVCGLRGEELVWEFFHRPASKLLEDLHRYAAA